LTQEPQTAPPPAPPAPLAKRNETAVRAVVALAMIAAFGLATYADIHWLRIDVCFQVIILAVCLLALREFYAMMRVAGHKPFAWLGAAGMTAMIAITWAVLMAMDDSKQRIPFAFGDMDRALYPCAVMAVFAIALLAAAAARRDWTGVPGDMGVTVFGVMYVWFLPAFFLGLVRHIGRNGDLLGDQWVRNGAELVIATILTAKASDIFAYLGGRLTGRHKMTPRLSPKKTWEGFAWGLAGSVVAALMFYYASPDWLRFFRMFNSPLPAAVYGLVLGVASVWGDLTASLIKRSCGAKDSGAVVPGYGGVIDVIDSLVVAGPAAYICLLFLSYFEIL
jgi:phosphatidate cytidylyltransferase